jgi:hypothetical protein
MGYGCARRRRREALLHLREDDLQLRFASSERCVGIGEW